MSHRKKNAKNVSQSVNFTKTVKIRYNRLQEPFTKHTLSMKSYDIDQIYD